MDIGDDLEARFHHTLRRWDAIGSLMAKVNVSVDPKRICLSLGLFWMPKMVEEGEKRPRGVKCWDGPWPAV